MLHGPWFELVLRISVMGNIKMYIHIHAVHTHTHVHAHIIMHVLFKPTQLAVVTGHACM